MKRPVWRAAQNLFFCHVPLGDCLSLPWQWTGSLCSGERKTSISGLGTWTWTLYQKRVLNDCLLNDEWRIPPHYSCLWVPRMLATTPSPPHEIGESSVKNLTGKRKDPKVVTSETPPRSLYRKVQIQDAHLYTAAFRQLFSPSLSLSKTHLSLAHLKPEGMSLMPMRDQNKWRESD